MRLFLVIAATLIVSQANAQVPNLNPSNASPMWLAPDPRGALLTHLNTDGSMLLKNGRGWISTISINTASAGTLTIYDSTNATGKVMAVIDVSKQTANVAVVHPWPFEVGCFVVLAAPGSDVTIITH